MPSKFKMNNKNFIDNLLHKHDEAICFLVNYDPTDSAKLSNSVVTNFWQCSLFYPTFLFMLFFQSLFPIYNLNYQSIYM